MDYRCITDRNSKQWKLLNSGEVAVCEDGLIRDAEGYIGVAIGTYYSSTVGERFIVTLENGKEIPIIITDIKNPLHTYGGGNHRQDSSMIEFVIDTNKASSYYGFAITMGNFDVEEDFHGNIVRIEKIIDNKNK